MPKLITRRKMFNRNRFYWLAQFPNRLIKILIIIDLTDPFALLYFFLGVSSGVRDSKGRELAETRGLDPREISGRRELPAVAVLRAERWRMLDEIFGTACRGQTRLHRRRRGHMHQPVLQTNPHGERRGEDTFLVSQNTKKNVVRRYQLLFTHDFIFFYGRAFQKNIIVSHSINLILFQ